MFLLFKLISVNFFFNHTNDEKNYYSLLLSRRLSSGSDVLFYLPFTSGFASSAGSEDEDDEGLDPAVKVVKEKERRQANNARER